jgi:hypothetical protein
MITTASTGRTFGSFANLGRSNDAFGSSSTDRKDRPQAQTWLNIGYMAGEGEDAKFVSLPVGIPLDTQQPKDLPRSEEYGLFVAAQNKLLEQMQQAAADLKPGEDIIIGIEGGLCVQLRRIAGPVEARPTDAASNPYVREFNIGGRIG